VQGAAVPRVRQSLLLDARRRENLTQLQPAMRAMAAEPAERQSPSRGDASEERARRIAAWENWIGAWERGVDAQSAPYIPPLARAVGVDPLALFDVDLAGRPFTALRMAAGLTLQALSEAAEYDAAERTQDRGYAWSDAFDYAWHVARRFVDVLPDIGFNAGRARTPDRAKTPRSAICNGRKRDLVFASCSPMTSPMCRPAAEHAPRSGLRRQHRSPYLTPSPA
jgi:transcriptional regulator with XRE-family HTH domain